MDYKIIKPFNHLKDLHVINSNNEFIATVDTVKKGKAIIKYMIACSGKKSLKELKEIQKEYQKHIINNA